MSNCLQFISFYDKVHGHFSVYKFSYTTNAFLFFKFCDDIIARNLFLKLSIFRGIIISEVRKQTYGRTGLLVETIPPNDGPQILLENLDTLLRQGILFGGLRWSRSSTLILFLGSCRVHSAHVSEEIKQLLTTAFNTSWIKVLRRLTVNCQHLCCLKKVPRS